MNPSRNIGASDRREAAVRPPGRWRTGQERPPRTVESVGPRAGRLADCALAFLQAQAWQQALGPMVSPAGARRLARLGRPRPGAARLGVGIWSMCWLWRPASWWPCRWECNCATGDGPRHGRPHGPAVESWPRPTTPPTAPATRAPSLASKAQPSLAAAPANPWQMVTLTAGGGTDGTKHSFELPARKCDKLDEAWLSKLPAAVPPEVIEALRQSGHEVRERRELLPVEMQDGSRLVVPVDEVDIHNARRPPL